MRKTVFVLFLLGVIAVSACSAIKNADLNLTVVNQSSAEIASAGVDRMNESGGSTEVAQNADSTPLAKNARLTFEMDKIADCTFALKVMDKSGLILTSREFTLDFADGAKHTVYILDDGSGGVYLSE